MECFVIDNHGGGHVHDCFVFQVQTVFGKSDWMIFVARVHKSLNF